MKVKNGLVAMDKYERFVLKVDSLLEKEKIELEDVGKVLQLFSLSLPLFSKLRSTFGLSGVLYPSFLKLKEEIKEGSEEAKERYHQLVGRLFKRKYFLLLRIEKSKEEKEEERLQKAIEKFKKIASSFHPIVKAFVEPFLEKKVSIKRVIEEEKRLIALNEKVQGKIDAFMSEGAALYQEFHKKSCSIFSDYASRFQELLRAPFVCSIDALPGEIEKRRGALEALLRKGERRKANFSEISSFQSRAVNVLDKLSRYKDMEKEHKMLSQQIEEVQISEREMLSWKKEEIKEKLEEGRKRYQQFSLKAISLFKEAHTKAHRLEEEFYDSTRTVKRRLFEIFSLVTPYPDLFNLLERRREELVKSMREETEAFFSGKRSIEEVRKKYINFAYDPDVRHLRSDFIFRASRLKELRDVAHQLLERLELLRRFTEIIGLQHEHASIAHVIEKVTDLLDKIENPFYLFEHASLHTYESANAIFRECWVEIEEYQKRVEHLEEKCAPLFKQSQKSLIDAFFYALDNVEKMIKSMEGKRPNLVALYRYALRDIPEEEQLDNVLHKIDEIEKCYPFLKPFSFFMLFKDFEKCLSAMREAEKIYRSIESTIRFSKDLQMIKLFEEGHIDTVLEVFDRRYIIGEKSREYALEALFAHAREYKLVIDRVEKEVMLDIGLVDRRALFDIEKEKLEKILSKALKSALYHGKKIEKKLLDEKHVEELSQAFFNLHKEVEAVKEWDDDKRLFFLRSFCHLFFEERIYFCAKHANLSALLEYFTSSCRSFAKRVEEKVQEKEGLDPVLGPLWVPECFEIKKQIELLELEEESYRSIEKGATTIFSLLEGLSGEVQEDLKEEKKELIGLLERIGEAKRRTAFDHPLHVIPGCINFFRRT